MRLRGSTCLRVAILAVAILAIGAAHSQPAEAAENEGKLGVLALPNVFFMPETGFGAGFMAMLTKPLPATQDGMALADSLRAGGSYTQNGQLSGWTSLELFLGRSRARFGVDASISRYPSRFFGVGPSAASDEVYVPFMGSASASLSFRVAEAIRVGPRFRFAASRTLDRESGGILATSGLRGNEGYLATGLGFTATYDSRDSSITPTKGAFFDLGYTASPGALGSGEDFGLACLDARTYLAPFSALNMVLALQARAELCFGDAPFQELPRIGGDRLMRGFYDGRYRDSCAAALQAELRLPLWWRFGVTAFGGLAQVAPGIAAFDLSDPKVSGGVGIRVRLDDTTNANMRVDIAWADGGPQFYFNFAEAF